MYEPVIIDIETCPIDLDNYFSLSEDDQLGKLNHIDSKIVAIGLRYNGTNRIFQGSDEKKILDDFWLEYTSITRGNLQIPIVGFNICDFDLPFIVGRSFIHEVTITPFILKQVIDIREKITAYKYRARGKLKEYAELIGEEILDINGGDVAKLCKDEQWDKLKEYLNKDLELTDKLYKRALKTNITKIARW